MNNNKRAYVFPGQGAQKVGMGRDLFERFDVARKLFGEADEILGFKISEVMFGGTEEELRRTDVTQPAIFIHSYVASAAASDFRPDMVAGHSLGEFSALAAVGALSFEDALKLVSLRASAMQKACEQVPGTMAAVLALEDSKVEEVCGQIEGVVTANYNCPGQVVISGTLDGVRMASDALREAGARKVLPLSVGGAFHSPLMEPARRELAQAINNTIFKAPSCPVYQNVDARPHVDISEIKDCLLRQLTSPVRWSQTLLNMQADGAAEYCELGPGEVLRNLIKKCVSDPVFFLSL